MKELMALLAGLTSPVQDSLPNKPLYVDLAYKDISELHQIVDKGYDVAGVNHEGKTITIVMRGSGLRNAAGMNVKAVRNVMVPDAKYKKPADIEQSLKNAERDYPNLAYVESIGKSIEGRDIWAINLSAKFVNSGSPKPAILFDAMHHAREVMTPEIALDIVDYLTKEYATNSKVQEWLNNYQVWVVPMVNPDGNQKMWDEDSMWRKNNRDGHGVDINRNYPYDFDTCNGSSGSKSSQTYRGESAGSEPETQALMSLAKKVKPKFNVSYHSFSEIVIYPFGCNPKTIPDKDKDKYIGTGKELAKKLKRDSGSGTYRPGTSYELLYNVDGGSVDWMYVEEKIMSYVIEVNSSSQGFQPSYDRWRDKTVAGQRPGWQFLLGEMSKPGIRDDE